jgi:hypothetical protein
MAQRITLPHVSPILRDVGMFATNFVGSYNLGMKRSGSADLPLHGAAYLVGSRSE